jgi:hypothetical protein
LLATKDLLALSVVTLDGLHFFKVKELVRRKRLRVLFHDFSNHFNWLVELLSLDN